MKVRLLTLKILELFEQPVMEVSPVDKEVRTCLLLITYFEVTVYRGMLVVLLVMLLECVSVQRKLICHY